MVLFLVILWRGINVTTLDIDKELKPDVVGSALDIFQRESFQVVTCYEG